MIFLFQVSYISKGLRFVSRMIIPKSYTIVSTSTIFSLYRSSFIIYKISLLLTIRNDIKSFCISLSISILITMLSYFAGRSIVSYFSNRWYFRLMVLKALSVGSSVCYFFINGPSRFLTIYKVYLLINNFILLFCLWSLYILRIDRVPF